MGEAIGQGETLSMWTVYEDPADFPGEIVARRWIISAGSPSPTHEVIRLSKVEFKWPPEVEPERRVRLERTARLRAIREAIQSQMPGGATCLQRNLTDDPKIVETWL